MRTANAAALSAAVVVCLLLDKFAMNPNKRRMTQVMENKIFASQKHEWVVDDTKKKRRKTIEESR